MYSWLVRFSVDYFKVILLDNNDLLNQFPCIASATDWNEVELVSRKTKKYRFYKLL